MHVEEYVSLGNNLIKLMFCAAGAEKAIVLVKHREECLHYSTIALPMHAFPAALFRKTSIIPNVVVDRKIMFSATGIIKSLGKCIDIIVNEKAGTLR